VSRDDTGKVRAMLARILSTVVVVTLTMAAAAAASDSPGERASLAGLTAISVVVEEMAPIADKSGLTTASLQMDVERRIRQAGISLVPDSDAYLYVRVTAADPGSGLAIPYYVDVSLMQEITLPRGLTTRTPLQCPTWWLNRLGMTGSDRLRAQVTERVAEFVDRFVAAYRAANSKP